MVPILVGIILSVTPMRDIGVALKKYAIPWKWMDSCHRLRGYILFRFMPKGQNQRNANPLEFNMPGKDISIKTIFEE